MSVYPVGLDVRRSAVISDDAAFRYSLIRRWGSGSPATFVMLNPSTADGQQDDPTIRRCVGFARRLGADGIIVLNLYAYRATKPADLWRAADPVGPDNDRILRGRIEIAAHEGHPLIAAWGAHARQERVEAVLSMPGAAAFRCLGRTKSGAPRHPLYVAGDSALVPLDGAS